MIETIQAYKDSTGHIHTNRASAELAEMKICIVNLIDECGGKWTHGNTGIMSTMTQYEMAKVLSNPEFVNKLHALVNGTPNEQ
jgi:hypothetical protein